MRNIDIATKVLKKIEPKEFYGLKQDKDKIILLRTFFDEGQEIGEIDAKASWKDIVKRFKDTIEWFSYMQQESDQYGSN